MGQPAKRGAKGKGLKARGKEQSSEVSGQQSRCERSKVSQKSAKTRQGEERIVRREVAPRLEQSRARC
jgi:hypothetical protein